MTLWTLLQGCILFVNAVAILNNDRFLEKIGWGYSQIGSNNLAAHPNALKSQLIGGLHAVAYLRVPLIVVNTVVILVKLVFG
ncbi:hypothetical protein ABBQ32_003932 [Trebouxia sp. C0010 RCD-2024]